MRGNVEISCFCYQSTETASTVCKHGREISSRSFQVKFKQISKKVSIKSLNKLGENSSCENSKQG